MKLIIYLIVFFNFLYTQGFDSDIKLIDVKVKGNTVTSKNTIIFTSGLHKGQNVKTSEFPRAVKKLWKLGLFKNIQILYEEETKEGISIIILVDENFILGNIEYDGNKKIKDKKFEEEILITKGQRIESNTIKNISNQIKNLYKEKGYLNVDVNPSIVMPSKDMQTFNQKSKGLMRNIKFKIVENDKIKIKNIQFVNNEVFSDFRLRWKMKEVKEQPWYLFWRSPFNEKKLNEDKALISKFYRDNGYRDFKFELDSLVYSSNNKELNITFFVYEGEKYKYRNFSWEGMSLFNEDVLQSALGLKNGDVYDEEDFNIAVFSRVQGLYLDRGYIYSRIQPQITPIAKDSIDINFSITENHKVFINNIAIKGNTRTRENVIRRQLRVFPGDVYNQERIARSYREVMMLNFFANAAPNIVPVSEDKVDINFVVEEKPAGQANANMGYTQSIGMTGGGGLALPNFRGKGQSLSISFSANANQGSNYNYNYNANQSKYRSASISFTDPMVNDTKNLLGGSIFYQYRGGGTMYYSPINYTIAGGNIMWGRIFKWPDDYFRGTWQFQMTRRINDADSYEELQQYAGGLEQSDGISISQTIRRDSRDHPEFSTIGSHFSLKSMLSGWILGGEENFHKHNLNLEWYTPTFWKFVLMNSMKIGFVSELPSLKKNGYSFIPYNDRFLMGGNGIPYGNPLRGYDDNSVGPLTSTNSPIGGNTLVKFGTEFRVPFSQNPVVYGLIFAEMGNVWSTKDLMVKLNLPRNGPFDLKRSMGAGVRFFMPMIGLLGFDIGYGFDRIENGKLKPDWKTTLTFGQQF